MENSPPGQERLCWRSWPCPECSKGITPIGHLISCFGASKALSTGSFEQIAAEQIEQLRTWLDKCPHTISFTFTLPRLDEGSEHLVCMEGLHASVLKQTRPGTYGDFYYIDKATGLVFQENCWPLEYLIRMRLWDKVLGGAPQILGMTPEGRFVSRQKFISGAPPTQTQVDDFLLKANLDPVRQDRWLWKKSYPDENTEIWVGDARADNFVLTDGGVVPIDLRLWLPS